MYIKHSACPKCGLTDNNIIKKGYTTPKHNYQPFPRYECKGCGYLFSSHSHRTNKFHKKPETNDEIFQLACSGVSLARITKILEINKKTTERKIEWLSKQAQIAHEKALNNPNNAQTISRLHIQLDEMETFESSRLKPLSITIAINADTGFIYALDVATMNCHGKLSEKAREKYGIRKDTRKDSLIKVLELIKSCGKSAEILRKVAETSPKFPQISPMVPPIEGGILISCDSKKLYSPLIKRIIPEAKISQYSLVKQKRGEPKLNDPLFTINNLCAKLRADVAPLARKSWTTTKSVKGLQNLLWIYLAWSNQYNITNNTNTTDLA